MAGRTQNETTQDAIRRGNIAPPLFNLPAKIGPLGNPAQRLSAAEFDFAQGVARRRSRLMLPSLFQGIGKF